MYRDQSYKEVDDEGHESRKLCKQYSVNCSLFGLSSCCCHPFSFFSLFLVIERTGDRVKHRKHVMRVERDRDPRSNKPRVTREDEGAVKGKQEQSTKREARKKKQEKRSKKRVKSQELPSSCLSEILVFSLTPQWLLLPVLSSHALWCLFHGQEQEEAWQQLQSKERDVGSIFSVLSNVFLASDSLSLSSEGQDSFLSLVLVTQAWLLVTRECISLTPSFPTLLMRAWIVSLYTLYTCWSLSKEPEAKRERERERKCEWYGFKVSSHIEWKQRKRRSWWGFSHDHAGSWIERRKREDENILWMKRQEINILTQTQESTGLETRRGNIRARDLNNDK